MLNLCQRTFCSLGRTRALPLGRFSSSASATTELRDVKETNDSTLHEQSAAARRISQNNAGEDVQGNAPPKHTPYMNEQEENFTPFRYVYPEFLPDPNLKWRNRVREKLERMDMLRRRNNIDIPEFYVGSILSITVSDPNAPGKTNSFMGLCTERNKNGLRSTFTLRNVVDGHGVEICYDLYNPTILNITCLRLERRLDETLRYLRDAPLEYSAVPFDMVPELRSADAPVPVNPIKVTLNPMPWTEKWHLQGLKGIKDWPELAPWQVRKMKAFEFCHGKETEKYDLMKTYRSTIPAEDQTEIYSEVYQQLAKLTASLRKQKRKRTFVKPQKTV